MGACNSKKKQPEPTIETKQVESVVEKSFNEYINKGKELYLEKSGDYKVALDYITSHYTQDFVNSENRARDLVEKLQLTTFDDWNNLSFVFFEFLAKLRETKPVNETESDTYLRTAHEALHNDFSYAYKLKSEQRSAYEIKNLLKPFIELFLVIRSKALDRGLKEDLYRLKLNVVKKAIADALPKTQPGVFLPENKSVVVDPYDDIVKPTVPKVLVVTQSKLN